MNTESVPQHDPEPGRAEFRISGWDHDGLATIEAAGHDLRSTLEAGLRAVLALSEVRPPSGRPADKSVAVQGEGKNPASLFAALVNDVLDQAELYGDADAIAVDGVLRRDDGGYLAWGYLSGSFTAGPVGARPMLTGEIHSQEEGHGELVLTATLRRQ